MLWRGLVLGLAVAAAEPGHAEAPIVWPGSPVGRLMAMALLQSLNADLLSHDSATLTLDRWCAAHHLAPVQPDGAPPRIVAERVKGENKPAGAKQRRLLGVDDVEPVRYRRVRLSCGGRVLSVADNWYVPARLTPAMNTVLDTTDTAFGRAVQDLHFTRHTLSAELLWQPLPAEWEVGETVPTSPSLAVPAEVLRHAAVLTLPNGMPFSTVVETYTGEMLAFRPPKLP